MKSACQAHSASAPGASSGTALTPPAPSGQGLGARQKIDIVRTLPAGRSRAILSNAPASHTRGSGPLFVGQVERARPVQEEVVLAAPVTPEVKVPAAPPVRLRAADLGAGERFPQRPASGEERRASTECCKFYDLIEEFV